MNTPRITNSGCLRTQPTTAPCPSGAPPRDNAGNVHATRTRGPADTETRPKRDEDTLTSLDRFQITTSRGGTNELRCDQHPDQLLATWHDTMPLTQLLTFAFAHNLEHHRDDGEQWYLPVNSALAELLNAIGTPPLSEQQLRRDVAAAQEAGPR